MARVFALIDVELEIESVAARDRDYPYVKGELVLPEHMQHIFDSAAADAAWNKLDSLGISFPTPHFTDYVVIE